MSRRRPKDQVQYEYAAVDIECPRGHLLGHALKFLGGPRTGAYGTSKNLRFEESPQVEAESGRLRGTCPDCGADVIVRWSTVRALIESNIEEGRHTDRMRP